MSGRRYAARFFCGEIVMNSAVDLFVETTLMTVRNLHARGKEFIPSVCLWNDDSEKLNIGVMPDFCDTPIPIRQLMIGRALKQFGAHSYAIASEAWMAKIPEGGSREDLPESLGDHPGRTEVLMFAGCWLGEPFVIQYDILREPYELRRADNIGVTGYTTWMHHLLERPRVH